MIKTVHLFPDVNKTLIELLKSLTKEEWLKPTVIKGRTVKDIASHVLDGSMRRLSLQRDGFSSGEPPIIKSHEDLVDFIQSMNSSWIEVSKRLSPQILISLLEVSENQLVEFFRSVNLNDKSSFSVTWAGENESLFWFDIAREYTEKWHHQAQIFLAVNKRGMIHKRRYMHPVLDIFMLGAPHAYNTSEVGEEGSAIVINITGKAGGKWYLEKEERWKLLTEEDVPKKISTTVTIPDHIAWRLFTDSIELDEAMKLIDVKGDSELANPILNMTTVMRKKK